MSKRLRFPLEFIQEKLGYTCVSVGVALCPLGLEKLEWNNKNLHVKPKRLGTRSAVAYRYRVVEEEKGEGRIRKLMQFITSLCMCSAYVTCVRIKTHTHQIQSILFLSLL